MIPVPRRTRFLWPAILLLLAAARFGVCAEPRTGSDRLPAKDATLEDAFATLAVDTVPDGRLFAPFYDYVIGPHAVATREAVYCTFQNNLGQPQVMVYKPAPKTWDGPVTASRFGLKGDDHGNPSICADRQGYLHIFYGCHGGPMRHVRSVAPWDIAAWEEQSAPTPRATYPQSMLLADGTICLMYRAGGHMEPWTLRTSSDDGRTWSQPERVIEMRLDPPDKLAAAYCDFFPGSDARTIHCFWNHKDDNAARVTDSQPHPWRPLKYPGLHEAVYRYNVYYARRDADGFWRNAAGQLLETPISKAEADARCLVFDSGDEFAMVRTRLAVDSDNRPYIRFGVGVVDWVRLHKDPGAVIVPVTDHFAHFAEGQWQVSGELPKDWPAEVVQTIRAPGVAAYGHGWPAGPWSIFASRQAIAPGVGCCVFLYNNQDGYAVRAGGPAKVQ
ncbi:MAG: BNR repeat-containing protein [Planctomycetes bacterium]|nr:BNR repeat-containing protein [Planctomycetota bacterium]